MSRSVRKAIDRWEAFARPEGSATWFAASEQFGINSFDPETREFSALQAWWLASLCRIAYTPDRKESPRPWHRTKPARHDYLEHRSPFREVINLHKTGNHVALYRLEGRPGGVLCFRGTTKLRQWLMNLTALPAPWTHAPDETPDSFVHQGFQLLFDRVWPLIEPSLIEIEGPLVFTGHSLGGAFATLAVAAWSGTPASITTFGSPRVGNRGFADLLAARNIPHLRVVNHLDIVTALPQHDPAVGDRDFCHAAVPILLGESPGAVLHPPPSDTPDWPLENPLPFLANSFTGPEPPECLLAHLPSAYEEKLRVLAEAQP